MSEVTANATVGLGASLSDARGKAAVVQAEDATNFRCVFDERATSSERQALSSACSMLNLYQSRGYALTSAMLVKAGLEDVRELKSKEEVFAYMNGEDFDASS